MDTCRMIVADDHAVIRTGLRYLLARHFDLQDIGEADSCAGLMAALASDAYTHVILDLQLGDCNSMGIIGPLQERFPGMAILVYTMSPETIFAKRLLQTGISGFLSKQAEEAEVIRALECFLSGRAYVSDAQQRLLHNDSGKHDNPFSDLSERETSVLRYLLEGHRVKEISNQMDLKMSTVATYKVRIFEKLKVDNLMDLQRLANAYDFI